MKKQTPKRNSKGKFIKQGNLVSDDIFIPNHSGNLDAGKILNTPVNDTDVVNKQYVDDKVGLKNLDGGKSNENFGGIAISPIDGGTA